MSLVEIIQKNCLKEDFLHMGIQKNKEKCIINAKERKQIENREAIDNIKRAY